MILEQLRSYVVERPTTLELGLNLVVVQQMKEALVLKMLEPLRS